MHLNIIKVLLILLVCIPMSSTDIFVPALPVMLTDLHTSISTLNSVLTSYMIGFSISMLLSGTLSDIYGRKKILLMTIGLYTLVCFLTLFCHHVYVLILLRFFQGLGGGSGTVVGRLILKDMFSDKEQVNMMSTLSTGMALAPAISPQIGAFVSRYAGWQSTFFITFLIGLFVLSLIIFVYKETNLSPAKFNPLMNLPYSFLSPFQSKIFIGYTLLIGFAWCAYFNFIGLSSFLFQKVFHFTENYYALVIAVVTLGYLLGTTYTRRLNKLSFSLFRIIRLGVLICFASSLFFLLAFLIKSSVLMIVSMMAIRFGIGLIMPTSQVGAMRVYSSHIGWYMGCLFFIEFVLGGITLYGAGFLEKYSLGLGMTVSILFSILFLSYGLYLIRTQKGFIQRV